MNHGTKKGMPGRFDSVRHPLYVFFSSCLSLCSGTRLEAVELALVVPVVGYSPAEHAERQHLGMRPLEDRADDVRREVHQLQTVVEERPLHPHLLRQLGQAGGLTRLHYLC